MVVGAGGAGRALAFGAAVKGARVVVANRSLAKAQELAAQVRPGASWDRHRGGHRGGHWGGPARAGLGGLQLGVP